MASIPPDGDHPSIPQLILDKEAAFERLRPDFVDSFGFLQRVHGQRRFMSFPVSATMRYLHALYICEIKDLLLSVPHASSRYDGARALDLLRHWQEGATAEVVSFLEFKLDVISLGQLTQQIQEAEAAVATAEQRAVVSRLRHGRKVLLNRSINLYLALDAIFAVHPVKLMRKVRIACEWYGHTSQQIEEQQALLGSPLVRYQKHSMLAQTNMRLMNELGVKVMDMPTDRPKERTVRVSPAEQPLPAYADSIIVHKTFTPPPYFPVSYYPISVSPGKEASASVTTTS